MKTTRRKSSRRVGSKRRDREACGVLVCPLGISLMQPTMLRRLADDRLRHFRMYR